MARSPADRIDHIAHPQQVVIDVPKVMRVGRDDERQVAAVQPAEDLAVRDQGAPQHRELMIDLEELPQWPVAGIGELHGAHLSRAYLFETRLPAARLSGANLRNAYLGGAYLEEANLSGANLSGANLFRANLKGAKLQNAYLGGADLREAIGLTVAQLKAANYWEEAIYSDDLLKKLDLPENHNETLEKKWTEFRRKEREEWGLP